MHQGLRQVVSLLQSTWEHTGEGETPLFIYVSRAERQGFALPVQSLETAGD